MDLIRNQGYHGLYYCWRILYNLCDFYISFFSFIREKEIERNNCEICERKKRNDKIFIIRLQRAVFRKFEHSNFFP